MKRVRSDHEVLWQKRYQLLMQYVKREGHSRVPARHEENGVRLGRWVHAQRQRRDRLDDKRREALEALDDWNWKGQDAKWERAYAILLKYVSRHGHAVVPKLYIEDDFTLGIWVMHQRSYYRNGTLSEERQKRLERVTGWSWFPREDAYRAMPKSTSDPLPPHIANASIDELAEEMWYILFGLGGVSLPIALDLASKGLYDKGLIKSRATDRGTKTGDILHSALMTAVEYGFMDSPQDGFYRAVLPAAQDYGVKDWQMCLFNSIEGESVGREEAIRKAAEWAKKNLGLASSDLSESSPVWLKLDDAIDRAIKEKSIKQTVFYGVMKLHVVE